MKFQFCKTEKNKFAGDWIIGLLDDWLSDWSNG